MKSADNLFDKHRSRVLKVRNPATGPPKKPVSGKGRAADAPDFSFPNICAQPENEISRLGGIAMFKKTKFLDPFPLLHGLWLVAISDGKLDPSELEFLKQVVSGLQQATGKSGKLAEFGNFDSVIDHLSTFTEEEHMRHLNSTSYFEERPNRQVAFELFSKLAMVNGALEDHEVVAMMRVLIEIGADGEEFAYPGGEKFLVDKELLHEMEQELGALVLAAATSIFGLVAMADGQITPEELRAFTEAVRRELNFDISQEQAQGLFIDFLENDEESHMDRIRKASDFPEFQRQILFQFAREAAEAHSETDQNESRHLREISEALGLDLLSEGEGEAVSKDRMEVSPGMCVPQADSSEMIVLIRASFSACFLVAASDGEISGDEIRTFMHELQERYDLETEEDDVVETFRDALGLDLEDHLHRIAEAVSLPEHIRREIIQVALAVAASDGNIAIDEILCLPDIAAALDIELSGEEQDEDEGEEAEVESDTATEAIDEPQGIPFGLYDGIIAQVRADQPERKSGATIESLAKAIDLIDSCLQMKSNDIEATPAEWRVKVTDMSIHEAADYVRELAGSPIYSLMDQGCASYSPDGKKVLTLSYSPLEPIGKLSVWNSDTADKECEMDFGDLEPAFCGFSHDGTKVISLLDEQGRRYNDGFRLWDTETGKQLRHCNEGKAYFELVVSPSSSYLLGLGWRWDVVHLWNFETGCLTLDLKLEGSGEPTAAFSADGSAFLVAIHPDHPFIVSDPIIVIDVLTGKEKWRSSDKYYSGTFSPDGSRLVALADDHVDLLDASSGEKVGVLGPYGAASAGFSPDGRYIFTQPRGGDEVRIWDAKAATLLHVFPGCQKYSSPAFSQDVTQLITLEGCVGKVRDLETGEVVRELDCGDRNASSAHFRPGGGQALIVSEKRECRSYITGDSVTREFKTTHVWDLSRRPAPHQLAQFSADAQFVISQALDLFAAAPLEGSSAGERFGRTFMIPLEERRLTIALQSECDIWPDGDNAAFDSLLRLRERMGVISKGLNQIVSDDPLRDIKLRQSQAELILSGLLGSVVHLDLCGDTEKARHRIREIQRSLITVLSQHEQTLVVDQAKALDIVPCDIQGGFTEDDHRDETEAVEQDEEDTEASEEFQAALEAAETALRAEGIQNPSSSQISLRMISDRMSGLKASVVNREGFAAWEAGDYEKARRRYLEAADSGDADAMYNLGQMHMAGEGVPIDWEKALSWWLQAAECGNLRAQRNAWKTLASGQIGVPVDEPKAIEIASMAAAQGDEESAQFVREKMLPSLQLSMLSAASLMAVADGTIGDEELITFGDAWQKMLGVELPLTELRELFEQGVSAGDQEDILGSIQRNGSILPLELRQHILRVSLLVALADQDFGPEEQGMVEKLAEALGVDLSDLGGGLGLERHFDEEEPEGSSIADQEEEYNPETNPVLVAALHGDADKVRSLLSEGHSATDIHETGTDAVILAVREGHDGIVDVLLAAGADPNRVNPSSGMTPLWMAIQERRPEMVGRLLELGADPNQEYQTRAGIFKPLTMLAVLVRSDEDEDEDEDEDDWAFPLIDLLLVAGANPKGDSSKYTLKLMTLAVQRRQSGTLQLLLKAGVDPNITDDESGLNILVGLILSANGDREGKANQMLDLLLEAGLKQQEIRVEDMRLAPVQFAAMQSDLPVGFLLRMAAWAEKEDLDLALWCACVEGITENVRDLIAAGADVNMTVPELEHDPSAVGDCPINAASTRGYVECVGLLIAAGADVNRNAPPEGGQVPLLMAAENGRAEIVGMLIEAGADVSMINHENETHALCGAVRNGYSGIVSCLLAAGADPNVRSGLYGRPVLNYAVNDGRLDIVQSLIDHGAEIDLADTRYGNTALSTAASLGHVDIVTVLLKHGADPRKVNPVQGFDALLAAVNGGQLECARLLLEAGANPNSVVSGNVGDIPLLVFASNKGDSDIVRLLLEHGAEPTATDGEGLTALQRAGIQGHKDVEAILIELGADPAGRLVKFTDTPAGQKLQNDLLSKMADTLSGTAAQIKELETDMPTEEMVSEVKPRGFWARLFGGSRRT